MHFIVVKEKYRLGNILHEHKYINILNTEHILAIVAIQIKKLSFIGSYRGSIAYYPGEIGQNLFTSKEIGNITCLILHTRTYSM